MTRWKPKDVIALVIIIGCFSLMALGHDSVISWALLGIVGAYYGIEVSPFLKLGERKKPKAEEPSDTTGR
uniref:Uncharacterized protein n=2 Tax=viral metagenome TaxID=1070528 RepID=A0A6M3XSY3_9ZZZZ